MNLSPTTSATRAALLALVATALAACSTEAPPAQESGIAAPSLWSRLTGSDTPVPAAADGPLAASDTIAVEQRWWQSFGDPALDRLIAGALAENKSLKIAEARVAEARAARSGATAALLPEVSIAGDASRGNQGYATSNKAINIGEIGLQASWEADLFGKNQARAAASAALVESEEAHRQGVMVALLAEVARTYFDLRNAEQQVAITTRNLATEQRTLDLIKAQREGALSSNLDVERAAAQVSTTSAQIPALTAQRDAALNRLNVLVGAVPGTQDDWLAAGRNQAFQPLPAKVLLAAPAAVLAARPDVRAAERSFAASLADKDAATKELYPTISLTSLFGMQNTSLFNATPWSLGAGLAQPVLNFGRIQSGIDAADARQTQAFLTYQQTVLEALEDMETALSLYLTETARQRDLAAAAEQNRQAVDLADQQYTAGYTGLLDLLVAQRNELDSESGLAASDAQLRKDLVRIYAAAGGGWDL